MIIGFTGSQIGMNGYQFDSLVELLIKLKPEEVHHGDCIGADNQFHDAVLIYSKLTRIYIHPPISTKKRAFCSLQNPFDTNMNIYWLDPKEYLARNKDIVNWSNLLIATPKEKNEELRSGTWATIRYARKINTPRIILYP